jgi:hypothetical protein
MARFRNKDGSGRYLTRLLFLEEQAKLAIAERTHPPVFSLYSDVEGLINCRRTFVDLGDPSGYLWVQEYLDGELKLWDILMDTSWFKQAYANWVGELELKLKAEAMKKIQDIAKGTSNQSFQANKYLSKEEWKPGTRGRPTKEEVSGALKKAVDVLEAEDEDMKRIGLTLITGGRK